MARVAAQHPDIQLQLANMTDDIRVFVEYDEAASMGIPIINCAALGDAHLTLVNVPGDWDYSLPFCLVMPRDRGAALDEFVQAVCQGRKMREAP